MNENVSTESILIESGIPLKKTIEKKISNNVNRIKSYTDGIYNFALGLLVSNEAFISNNYRLFKFRMLYDIFASTELYPPYSDMYSRVNKIFVSVGYHGGVHRYPKTLTNKKFAKNDLISITSFGIDKITINKTKPDDNNIYQIPQLTNKILGNLCTNPEGDDVEEGFLINYIMDNSDIIVNDNAPDWIFNYLTLVEKLVKLNAKKFNNHVSTIQRIYIGNHLSTEEPDDETFVQIKKLSNKCYLKAIMYIYDNINEIKKYRKYEKAY